MDIEQARSKVAALKPGDRFTVADRTIEVTSISCGVIEAVPIEYLHITGAYGRCSASVLAEQFARSEAT